MCNSLPIRLGSLITGSLPVLLAATAATAQIPCGYEVTAVIQGPWCGEIYGYPPTRGTGISEDGTVCGYYTSCDIGPSEAFNWRESTGFVTLDRPAPYTSAAAYDIDSQTGWIVGSLGTPGTDGPFAAVWADGEVLELGTLPGGDFSKALAISEGGTRIVGNWGNENTGPALRAFVWENGVMQDLELPMGPNSAAWDVSASGMVVGWMGQSFLIDSHAYIWQNNNVTDLGVIPGGFTASAWAISSTTNPVRVVGSGQIPKDGFPIGVQRPFLWDGTKMINLGILPGHDHGAAWDIRDGDVLQVVGGVTGGGEAAFIWQEGVMMDLNDLIPPEAGVEINVAYAIASDGWITSVGHDAAGDVVGLLLAPIESPIGDLDGDCRVGIIDLLILVTEWGEADSSADLNDDGIVNVLDLLILLANWG